MIHMFFPGTKKFMNRFKVYFYIVIAIVSVILIIYGINVFPIPGTDSRVFIPPALCYSKGLGFINPLYDITFLPGLYANSAQNFQFNYYVPFFSMLLGTLSKIYPGVKTIFFICSLFSIANLILYGKVISSLLPDHVSYTNKLIIICSVTYLATFILPTIGRPENLSSLLIFVVYIIYKKRTKINVKLYNTILCILFAFILSTQIIGFYFSFLLFLTYEILKSDNIYKTILTNAIRFIIIALVFLGILYLSPNGLFNTINGIKIHGSWALTRSDRSAKLFFYYWIISPINFGFAIIFILAVIAYIKSLYTESKKIKKIQFTLLMAIQLLILYSIPKFILYAAPTVYNATQFIFPLSVYVLLCIMKMNVGTIKKICNGAIIIAGIGGNILFFRWAILFVDYKTNGKDFNSARRIVNKIVSEHKNVRITPDLWPLLDTFSSVQLFVDSYKSGDVIILQQVYWRNLDSLIQKSIILYDWRTEEERKIFGIPLTNTPQCYSFIVCQMK